MRFLSFLLLSVHYLLFYLLELQNLYLSENIEDLGRVFYEFTVSDFNKY